MAHFEVSTRRRRGAHLARHGVRVQRDQMHWAGGGASLIMYLAMLLLYIFPGEVPVVHFSGLRCGGAFLIQRSLNKLVFPMKEGE